MRGRGLTRLLTLWGRGLVGVSGGWWQGVGGDGGRGVGNDVDTGRVMMRLMRG